MYKLVRFVTITINIKKNFFPDYFNILKTFSVNLKKTFFYVYFLQIFKEYFHNILKTFFLS